MVYLSSLGSEFLVMSWTFELSMCVCLRVCVFACVCVCVCFRMAVPIYKAIMPSRPQRLIVKPEVLYNYNFTFSQLLNDT